MGQRVALYCRVSTDDQSCERQERDLRALAERAGHEVVGVYMEKASGARNDRQERKKVMHGVDMARLSHRHSLPSLVGGVGVPRTSSRRWTSSTTAA